MIRHILLVRVKPDDSGAAADVLTHFARIAGLAGKLPGLRTVAFGSSRSPEDLERGYNYGLVADFADWESLMAYHADDDHRAAGAGIVRAALGGVDGLLVVDLHLPSAE